MVPRPPDEDSETQLSLWHRGDGPLARAPEHRIEWHRLMARTMGFNPRECPICAKEMYLWGFVTDREPERIAWYLRQHHGSKPPPPKAHRPRGPPQLELPFPKAHNR